MSAMSSVFEGPVFVVRDNIDTDQIIPAQYLNLVPTIQEEYEKLGSYALIGLPEPLYPARYVAEGEMTSNYPIVVAGRGGRTMQTGRCVVAKKERPLNDLFLSMLDRLDAEVESIGDSKQRLTEIDA